MRGGGEGGDAAGGGGGGGEVGGAYSASYWSRLPRNNRNRCHSHSDDYFMRNKRCVSTNPTDPVSNARLLSVKMQNKQVKHRPSTKYSYFHNITGPTLFFSGEIIEK